jgi:thiol-disulfide isomerase/thioredoxin
VRKLNSVVSIISFFVFLIVFESCVTADNPYTKIAPGIWRGILKLDKPNQMAAEEVELSSKFDFTELPFNFEVKYLSQDSFVFVIYNDTEEIIVSDIYFGRDIKTAKDTLIIDFPIFDSYIKAICEESLMEGAWHVNYKPNYSIPFIAYHGKDFRFPLNNNKPNEKIAGQWQVSFDYEKPGESYPAIANLKLDDKKLSGTFQTETGDYRYLEGTTDGDKFSLSCFDGAHAFLFEGKNIEADTIIGVFYSGKHYESNFKAYKTDKPTLENPYNLTLPTSDKPFQFSFENTEGQMVSLDDEVYKNKSKIIQIMGTWCPNCRDETKFLKSFLQKNELLNTEIISIGFERYRDKNKSIAALKRYKEKLELPYPVLHGGYYDKKEASAIFPGLNKIISYPTMIFLDKNNRIMKIHTGFNGPATDAYQEFTKEFQELLAELEKI